MIIIIKYKDGTAEDITNTFIGRINTEFLFQAISLLSGLSTVKSVEVSDGQK